MFQLTAIFENFKKSKEIDLGKKFQQFYAIIHIFTQKVILSIIPNVYSFKSQALHFQLIYN